MARNSLIKLGKAYVPAGKPRHSIIAVVEMLSDIKQMPTCSIIDPRHAEQLASGAKRDVEVMGLMYIVTISKILAAIFISLPWQHSNLHMLIEQLGLAEP
jgi:DNA-binding sugar fermentation-stimulating protein